MTTERRTEGVDPTVLAVAERAREFASSQPPLSFECLQELATLAGQDPAVARAAAELCNDWDVSAGDLPSGLAAVMLDEVQLRLEQNDDRLGLG